MNTRKITMVSLFIALCVVGAYIKIPSPTGSIALDAVPGFVGTIFLGSVYGAIIGAVGHLISAATSGFFMGIPAHLIVALTMAITMYVFGILYKKNKIIAGIVAVIINAPIGLVPFIFILGWGFYTLMILPLTIGALVNVILAMIILTYIKHNA